ncbi:hypothetical protein KIL84_012901 [Mauremys mutica]|uniref:Uncharacterized protein n=1 Tax=Mauremys mutica TaxID=74926 RepID=A0A9D3XTL4_9SAUR|nr:hypothetical protein KIL84_012901 [Mauremys mutica]
MQGIATLPTDQLTLGLACVLATLLSVLLPLAISSDPTLMHTTVMDTRMDPTRTDTRMDLDALHLRGVIITSIRSMAMVAMDTSMEVDPAAVLTRIKKAPPTGLAHMCGTAAAEAKYNLRTSISSLQFTLLLPFASSSK